MSDLRSLERDSIREFLTDNLPPSPGGRLLDHGAGTCPYRDVAVAAGYRYHPYDRKDFPANVSGEDIGPDEEPYEVLLEPWDAIVCTQVIQYVSEPFELLSDFRYALKPDGILLLTGPTCWPEVEDTDLWRFTRAGIRLLASEAGFDILRLDIRAVVDAAGESFPLGYGLVAKVAA